MSERNDAYVSCIFFEQNQITTKRKKRIIRTRMKNQNVQTRHTAVRSKRLVTARQRTFLVYLQGKTHHSGDSLTSRWLWCHSVFTFLLPNSQNLLKLQNRWTRAAQTWKTVKGHRAKVIQGKVHTGKSSLSSQKQSLMCCCFVLHISALYYFDCVSWIALCSLTPLVIMHNYSFNYVN